MSRFRKKSLNGHATVAGGHAIVGRLSNNVFPTFQLIRKYFEKSLWTITRQWSGVTRPLADCQTTFFSMFQEIRKFFEKCCWTVTRQWSEVPWPSAESQTTFVRCFKQIGKVLREFAERSRNSCGRDRRVTRPSADCQALSVLLLPNRQNTAPVCV